MADPYTLKKWKPGRERIPFAALVLASRNSGKSHLIRTLWTKYWHKRFDLVVVFCGSDYEETYPSFLPGRLFFPEYDPAVIEALQNLQEKRAREHLKALNILVILDDCSEGRERYEDSLRSLYTRGRHWKISVLFASQAVQLSDTVARNNSDFVLIGRQKGAGGRKLAIENFLMGLAEPSDIPSDQTEKGYLATLLKRNTRDYGFVVVSTSNPDASDFRDLVFHYRSDATF